MTPDQIKIGQKVNYHSLIGRPASIKGAEVLSHPFEMAGEFVVQLEGKSGVVSVEHLTEYKGAE